MYSAASHDARYKDGERPYYWYKTHDAAVRLPGGARQILLWRASAADWSLQLVLRADARQLVVTAATTTGRRLIYLAMPGFRCPRVLTNGLYIRRTSGLITGPSGRSPPPRLYKPKDCISTKRNGLGFAV